MVLRGPACQRAANELERSHTEETGNIASALAAWLSLGISSER